MEKRIRIIRLIILAKSTVPIKEDITIELVDGVSPVKSLGSYIRKWRRSEGQGYDKIDFRLVYEDGNTYEGRFDMEVKETRSLLTHVKAVVEYWLSRNYREGTGDYLVQQQWKAFAEKYEYTDAHADELSRQVG